MDLVIESGGHCILLGPVPGHEWYTSTSFSGSGPRDSYAWFYGRKCHHDFGCRSASLAHDPDSNRPVHISYSGGEKGFYMHRGRRFRSSLPL